MSQVKVGDKFCRLTVVDLIPDRKNPKAKCLCDCGNTCYPQRGALKNGRATSCGCKRADDFISRNTSHGMSRSPTYKIWTGMISRCNNKNLEEYKNYGGRGIKVEWNSFEEFLSDMGERPTGMWIDRINNDGNYCKENCRWSSPKENSENKRISKVWIINGSAYSSSTEAASALGIDVSSVNRRCNGYTKNGKTFPPKEGWHCALKYIDPLALK